MKNEIKIKLSAVFFPHLIKKMYAHPYLNFPGGTNAEETPEKKFLSVNYKYPKWLYSENKNFEMAIEGNDFLFEENFESLGSARESEGSLVVWTSSKNEFGNFLHITRSGNSLLVIQKENTEITLSNVDGYERPSSKWVSSILFSLVGLLEDNKVQLSMNKEEVFKMYGENPNNLNLRILTMFEELKN